MKYTIYYGGHGITEVEAKNEKAALKKYGETWKGGKYTRVAVAETCSVDEHLLAIERSKEFA